MPKWLKKVLKPVGDVAVGVITAFLNSKNFGGGRS